MLMSLVSGLPSAFIFTSAYALSYAPMGSPSNPPSREKSDRHSASSLMLWWQRLYGR